MKRSVTGHLVSNILCLLSVLNPIKYYIDIHFYEIIFLRLNYFVFRNIISSKRTILSATREEDTRVRCDLSYDEICIHSRFRSRICHCIAE